MPISKPSLYIIAGPNGAGKTTFAQNSSRFSNCPHFVNADLIAAGLSPFAPERVALRAGRLMLEEIHRLGQRRNTVLNHAVRQGIFPMLRDTADGLFDTSFFPLGGRCQTCFGAYCGRVEKGGHNVPEPVVRRRFDRGLINLVQLYRPCLTHGRYLTTRLRCPAIVRKKWRFVHPQFRIVG